MPDKKEFKKIAVDEELKKITGGETIYPTTTTGLCYCVCSDCHKGALYLEDSSDFICPCCGSKRSFSIVY